MKAFLANAWIDDREVFANHRVQAGTLYTAAIKAARDVRAKGFQSGRRKNKLTIRVIFVGTIDRERAEIIPADRFLPAEPL